MEHTVKLRLTVLVLCLLGVESSPETTADQAMVVLEQRVTAMETEIGRLQTQNEKTMECVTNISPDTAQCARETVMAGVSSYVQNVMFSATMNQTLNNVSEEGMVFDIADINVGDCYSGHTGIFNCCKAGYYIFFWSITTADYTETELMKNTSPVAVNIVGETETDSTGTMMVLLHLNLDDKVRIRMKPRNPPPAKPAFKRSSFSGMMIRG